MSIFYVLSWLGWGIEIIFAILCIAAGLYYIAETIEEYTESSRKIMQTMCFGVFVLTILLWFLDGIPLFMMLTGIFANSLYYILLQSFPFISMTSPLFIGSCFAFALKHYVALKHFADVYVPFDEVVGYFIVCCWVLPFTILISTTAGDNVLPYTNNNSGHNDVLSHYYTAHSKKTRSSFLRYLEIFKEKFMPNRTNKHLY